MTVTRLIATTLIVGLALALIILSVTGAMAQSARCSDRAAIVSYLTGTYGETLRGQGLTAQGEFVEVYAADATGTWTIVVTTAKGMSCMAASGDRYEAMSDALPPAGTEG